MALSTNIYAEVTTTFPASVEAGSGIIISKSGGVYTVSFDPSGIAMNSITNAQMATVSAQRLVGNPAGIAAGRSEISLGTDLEFTGTTVQGAAFTGAVTKDAGSTTTTLGTGVVGSANLTDGAVTSAKVGADAVDGTKIPDDAIGNEHIAADAVQAAQIATDAVTVDAIAANAVGSSELADNAVDTAAIADDAVTFAKISDMGNATVLSNVSGGSASPSANSLSALLNGTIGSTQGSVIYRGASAWSQLGPGTSGQFLKTNGAGANPEWAAGGSGGGLAWATPQAATSGTAIDFTGIPAGVSRIVMFFKGVSTNGTDSLLIQIGDSGGVENTNYFCSASFMTGAVVDSANSSAGFLMNTGSAATLLQGCIDLVRTGAASHSWAIGGVIGRSDTAGNLYTGGEKLLSAELDRVRITTTGGTNTFDAGALNIAYE